MIAVPSALSALVLSALLAVLVVFGGQASQELTRLKMLAEAMERALFHQRWALLVLFPE